MSVAAACALAVNAKASSNLLMMLSDRSVVMTILSLKRILRCEQFSIWWNEANASRLHCDYRLDIADGIPWSGDTDRDSVVHHRGAMDRQLTGFFCISGGQRHHRRFDAA